MALEISREDADAIRGHGEETFPHECCGFMLGEAKGENRRVAELLRADNVREEEAKHNRFLISPEDYLKGEKTARAEGLDVIGFYHSHPNAPAKPSQYDLDHGWPWYSYVIVSILDNVSDAMTSWIMADDRSRFDEEAIVTRDA